MSKQALGWGCAIIVVLGLGAVNQMPVQGQFGGGGKIARGRSTGQAIALRGRFGPAEQRIKAVLEQPLKMPLDFEGEPLDEILNSIAEEHNLPILFDRGALEVVGISSNSSVTIKLRNVTLRSALKLLFKEPGLEELCYMIDEEVLLVTTKEKQNSTLVTHVYRVDDLLDTKQERYNGMDQYGDPDQLIDLVVTNVVHDSWLENGTGEGNIQYYPPGMLVVSQTNRVHDFIERLLEELRRTKQQILSGTKSTASLAKPVTLGFAIQVGLGESPEQARKQLAEAIKSSVDWSANDAPEGDLWLNVLPNLVLVRHLPKVQRQVKIVLSDMRVLSSAGGGGGGGGGSF